MNNKKKKGFTLVEILVVLVIIGILVALILPNALRAIDDGNIKSAASTLRNIDTAIQLCYSHTQDWTQCNSISLLESGTPAYMDTLPNSGYSPWGGYQYTVIPDPGGTQGYISEKTVLFPNWPALSPVTEK